MKRAFSLIELLVTLGIMGIFLAMLPQFIPSFNSTGASRNAFEQFAARGRVERINRTHPVVLAYNSSHCVWALWELAEPLVLIDTLPAQKNGFDSSRSNATADSSQGSLRVKTLDDEEWFVWQYPTDADSGSAGGVIFYTGTGYRLNAVGNWVAIEQ